MRKLVAQNAPGCWLLAHSIRPVQAWFAEQKLPVVIAGYSHAGLKLPSVHIDVEAACRHAVGELVRAGHRRIVLFHEKTDRAGDLASEQGFQQGIALAQRPDLQARIVYYAAKEPDIIAQAVRRLFREKPAPTALLIGAALDYASVSTYLLRAGHRVPEDVSLICREEDNFLPFLLPRPAVYAHSPSWFASRIHEHLRKLLAGQPAPTEPVRVVPDYKPGDSVGRCL